MNALLLVFKKIIIKGKEHQQVFTMKISVEKNEEVSAVIDRVIGAEAQEIVIAIPKFSRFIDSVSNFHMLKRESETAGKQIRIESVDDRVIELAKECGLEAANPFFVRPERQFRDIVSAKHPWEVKREKRITDKSKHNHEEERRNAHNAARGKKEAEILDEEIRREFGEGEIERKQLFSKRRAVVIGAVLLVSGTLSILAFKVLPRVDLELTARREEWKYANVIVLDKTIRAADGVTMHVPGQVFTEIKNGTFAFDATGKKEVSEKASGNMVIYNSYSSDPQRLVATTRFSTGDGKIVRLKNAITVPGAKISDGKIIPSNITSEVISDKPGAEFNIGPTAKLTIPGFKGTPKYDAFYGEIKDSLKGGYTGVRAYPTDDDIKKAKNAATKTVENNLQLALKEKLPKEFTTFNGGAQFIINKQTLNTETNEAKQFTIFVEGELRVFAFRGSDVESLLAAKAKQQVGSEYTVGQHTVKYGWAEWDGNAIKINLPVDYKSVLIYGIDPNVVRGKVLERSEQELKALLVAMPGLESAKIKLWPFWVKSVPSSADKVRISVE